MILQTYRPNDPVILSGSRQEDYGAYDTNGVAKRGGYGYRPLLYSENYFHDSQGYCFKMNLHQIHRCFEDVVNSGKQGVRGLTGDLSLSQRNRKMGGYLE